MEVDAILCNHAEAQNNLLYMAGGGIDRALVPPGSPGPYQVSVAVAITIRVPWTATNQQHSLTLTLLDEDDHPVMMPTGPDTTAALEAQAAFNVGRPPILQTGESQIMALAMSFPVLPFQSLGRYVFVLSMDGTEMKRLPYAVMSQPGMTVTPARML